MEMARCLIIDVGLDHDGKAIMAAFIQNKTLTTTKKGTISQFEAMWE